MKQDGIDLLVDRYLSGTMGPRERQAFESVAAHEPDVAALLHAEQTISRVAASEARRIGSGADVPDARFLESLSRTAAVPMCPPHGPLPWPGLVLTVLLLLILAMPGARPDGPADDPPIAAPQVRVTASPAPTAPRPVLEQRHARRPQFGTAQRPSERAVAGTNDASTPPPDTQPTPRRRITAPDAPIVLPDEPARLHVDVTPLKEK